jgi:hypothetical protein
MSMDETNPSGIEGTDGQGSDRTETTGGIDRRGYLRLAGGAAASLAMLGSAGSAVGETVRNETIELSRNEHLETRLGDGDAFENVLIDATAGRCTHKLIADGDNWSIRNVAIKGRLTGDRAEQGFNLTVTEGGSAVVENLYMGDGTVDGNWVPIFVPLEHAGTLTFRNLHVAHWPNNGLYASAPGIESRGGRGGVVQIESCYAHNNNIDGFRIGTDGSYVRDSVVHVDGDVPDVFGGKENARGVWAREGGDVTIENCDILLEHPDSTYAVWESGDDDGVARVVDSEVAAPGGRMYRGNVRTTNVGNDPDPTPPSGVPMSPEEALDGTSGGGGGDPEPSGPGLFEISNRDFDQLATYQFSVDGALEPTDSVNLSDTDSISGSSAEGRVNGGADTYRVAGSITDLSIDGPASLTMDGQSVSAEAPNRLAIANSGDDGTTDYQFSASGALESTDELNSGDEISGSSAQGGVNGGTDAYYYGGRISGFEYDGEIAVAINGREANPNTLLGHYLRVQATENRTTYDFAVSEALRQGPEFDTDGTDAIDGLSASGQVGGSGADDYYFGGDLSYFSHDGDLDLYVDGEQVDLDTVSRPSNYLRVQGTGPQSTYEFDVSGALQAAPDFDNDGTDAIDGSTGSGRVNNTGSDDFYFEGTLDRFVHDGDLELYVNDEQVNPEMVGLEHVLSIDGDGSRAEYEFTVSGNLIKSKARGASINSSDEVSGQSASGSVIGGADSYAFNGQVTDFSIDNDGATVYVDGEEVDPGTSGGNSKTISITGTGERVAYEFTVSGDLQGTDSLNPADEVSGSSAQGVVVGATDQYRFSGELSSISVENPEAVSVAVDGEEIDIGSGGSGSHTITISNDGYSQPATYRFSVDGELRPTDSVNSGDEISGSSADGRVNGGSDTYRYTGAVTAFEYDGPLDVVIDGEQVQ